MGRYWPAFMEAKNHESRFPNIPEDLFPLKTRMQDGVGTTDVICHLRRMNLIKYGRRNGHAKYGRGPLDDEFQRENPNYYTDLFRQYFEDMFIDQRSIEEATIKWNAF